MTLRFAGVDLLLQDESGHIREWVERYFSLNDLRDIAAEPVYSGTQTPKFLSKPNYRRSPGLQINRLYWPTGASRWSVGHFILSTGQKNEIVKRLDWSQSQNTSLDNNTRERSGWLEFGEATTPEYDRNEANKEPKSQRPAQRLAVKMFMLPPRPISVRRQAEPQFKALPQSAENEPPTPTTGASYVRENDPDGLWIVPIVDCRYYWQFFNVGKEWAASLPGSGATTSADQFINTIQAIADRLGVNIYHSDINEDWGFIDPRFARETAYHNAAYILDCLAYSTGRRLVHHWSDMGEARLDPGTVSGGGRKLEWRHREFTLLTHDESFKRTTQNMHRMTSTISHAIPDQPGGLGERISQAGRYVEWSKGMVAGDDFSDKKSDYGAATIPQHVVVVFQKCIGGNALDPPATYERRYHAQDFTSVNTNEPQFVYWGSEKVIRVPAWAKWATGSQSPSPDNASDLDALGRKIAEEYYKSLKLRHDYSLAGIELWTETGYDDSVIYDFAGQDGQGRFTALTRVRSREHNHGVEVMCNQVDECGTIGDSNSPMSQQCCGGCAPSGSIPNSQCVHCGDGAPNSWTVKLNDTAKDGIVQTPDDCCDVLAEAQFLFHDGGTCGSAPCVCTWEGTELDVCEEGGTSPQWKLKVNGLDPYDADLCITLPGRALGGGDAEICYSNPYPWCCNCKNEMRLTCPTQLPVDCSDIPCNVCVEPGVACCPNALPNRLKATLAGVNLCGCLNGEVVDLVWDSAQKKWIGQKAVCGAVGNFPGPAHTIYIEFYCTAEDLTAGIGACTNYELVVDWLDNCSNRGTYSPSEGCTCDPYVVFETLNATNCCNETTTSGGSYKVTITA